MSDRRFKWRGEEAERLIREIAFQTIRDGAEAILTEAIDETPIDTGTLRRSGTITEASQDNVIYISFNTPYAVKQHEDLTLKHPRGGKAKYLEDPFKRNVKKVERLVVQRVKAALDRKE